MTKKNILLAAVCVTALAMVSCQKVNTPKTPDSVALATVPSSKPKTADSGTQGVTFYATSSWTATSTADWITVSPTQGDKGVNEVVLTYSANATGAQRSGEVIISSASNSESFILTQDK